MKTWMKVEIFHELPLIENMKNQLTAFFTSKMTLFVMVYIRSDEWQTLNATSNASFMRLLHV